MNEKNRRLRGAWLFRGLAGLGAAMRKELQAKGWMGSKTPVHALRQRDHDLLFVPRGLLREPDHEARIPDQILQCLVYGRFKVSKTQLDGLARELREGETPVRLAVSAEGRHFDRRDFRRWLAQRLAERGVAAAESGARTLWVFCVDQAYYMGSEVHAGDQAPGRDRRVAELEGSLPPTIAAAMAFLARPGAGDRMLDPTCGSGTLLAEAAGLQPGLRRVGIDRDGGALKAASANLKTFGGLWGLLRADSTRAPLRDGVFTLFLANLPFGKQFGDRGENPRLYGQLLDQMKRLGAKDWRAALLTSDLEALRASLEERPELAARKLFRVKIRGEWAEAHLIREHGPGPESDASDS